MTTRTSDDEPEGASPTGPSEVVTFRLDVGKIKADLAAAEKKITQADADLAKARNRVAEANDRLRQIEGVAEAIAEWAIDTEETPDA